MIRSAAIAMLSGVVALGLGCDDKSDVPPEASRAAEARERELAAMATRPAAPTTQELITGPKKTLRLGEFPVSLEVPAGWSMRSFGEGLAPLVTVSGPGSSGDIDIQLVQQSSIVPADRLEAMVNGARKEVAAKPHPINKVELRQIGPIKVLEQRMISNEFVDGKPPVEVTSEVPIADATSIRLPKGAVIPTTRAVINPHMVSWRFTLLIPDGSGKQYRTRGLTFQAMRLSEFSQDREFLETMMAGMKHED